MLWNAATLLEFPSCISNRGLVGNPEYTPCSLCLLSGELLMHLCMVSRFLGTVRGCAGMSRINTHSVPYTLYPQTSLVKVHPPASPAKSFRSGRINMGENLNDAVYWSNISRSIFLHSGLTVWAWTTIGSRSWWWKHESSDQKCWVPSHHCYFFFCHTGYCLSQYLLAVEQPLLERLLNKQFYLQLLSCPLFCQQTRRVDVRGEVSGPGS